MPKLTRGTYPPKGKGRGKTSFKMSEYDSEDETNPTDKERHRILTKLGGTHAVGYQEFANLPSSRCIHCNSNIEDCQCLMTELDEESDPEVSEHVTSQKNPRMMKMPLEVSLMAKLNTIEAKVDRVLAWVEEQQGKKAITHKPTDNVQALLNFVPKPL